MPLESPIRLPPMRSPGYAVILLLSIVAAAQTQNVSSLDQAREHFKAGRMGEANAIYASMAMARPELQEAHIQLIRTRLELNDVNGALHATAEPLKRFPDSPEILTAAADAQYRASRFTLTAQLYQKALQLDPKSARANLGMGRISQLASMNKTGRDYFLRAYELDPTDPDVALNVSKIRRSSQVGRCRILGVM
jgi:tetratricopeptide (TPR) repeat protein